MTAANLEGTGWFFPFSCTQSPHCSSHSCLQAQKHPPASVCNSLVKRLAVIRRDWMERDYFPEIYDQKPSLFLAETLLFPASCSQHAPPRSKLSPWRSTGRSSSRVKPLKKFLTPPHIPADYLLCALCHWMPTWPSLVHFNKNNSIL